MDKCKIQAIVDWEVATKVTELQSFLGLVNYYRRFIRGYLMITVPLRVLLKKGKVWDWESKCEEAFNRVKETMKRELVLALSNYQKWYEVRTDASNYAIGGVLMQDGHLIAFESRKLNKTEQCYTIQEKEMIAVVHCWCTWRHYLLGFRFMVYIDNVAKNYFLTQKNLSPKQTCW